ncbi:hypothetical protein ACIBQ6_22020 [Nonomuraea sp. NPDC049655]|uniref:hypothetical protein n=1 Tax=Nonomuraea sp. NPDC049655 TaxID=3364355 RepID=UPI00379F3A97
MTSAWTLAAYRDELLACGFPAEVAHQLVLIAAQGQGLVTDPMFEVRAEPPYLAAPAMEGGK